MDDFDDITCEEFYSERDAAFPFAEEYEAWMAAMEQDYIDECNKKLSIYAHSENEEFSPFSTVNS